MPAFQRFGQEGVVGVVEGLLCQRKGISQRDAVIVHQQAHKLRNGNGRVGVVELDGDFVGQVAQVAVVAQVAAHDVGDGGGGEEVLLAQAQALALFGAVVGVEHLADGFGHDLWPVGAEVVALIKGGHVQRRFGAGRPEPQRGGGLALPADDGEVVGHGFDGLARGPGDAAVALSRRAHEANVVGHFAALELPKRTAGGPVVGLFDLPAFFDGLLEEAAVVADAVAKAADPERRHGFHVAGRQPPQTAIAQSRIRLGGHDVGHGNPVGIQRFFGGFIEAGVPQGVFNDPADHELHGQVIDPLAVKGVGGLGRVDPGAGDVAPRQTRQRRHPVKGLGVLRVFADHVVERVEDVVLEGVG